MADRFEFLDGFKAVDPFRVPKAVGRAVIRGIEYIGQPYAAPYCHSDHYVAEHFANTGAAPMLDEALDTWEQIESD